MSAEGGIVRRIVVELGADGEWAAVDSEPIAGGCRSEARCLQRPVVCLLFPANRSRSRVGISGNRVAFISFLRRRTIAAGTVTAVTLVSSQSRADYLLD